MASTDREATPSTCLTLKRPSLGNHNHPACLAAAMWSRASLPNFSERENTQKHVQPFQSHTVWRVGHFGGQFDVEADAIRLEQGSATGESDAEAAGTGRQDKAMWRAMWMRLPSLSICSRANVRNREHGTTGQAERSKKKPPEPRRPQIPSARVQLLPILLPLPLGCIDIGTPRRDELFDWGRIVRRGSSAGSKPPHAVEKKGDETCRGRKGSGEVEWERNFVPWGNSVVDSCKKKGGAPREAWRGELRIVDMSGRADDSSSSTFGRPLARASFSHAITSSGQEKRSQIPFSSATRPNRRPSSRCFAPSCFHKRRARGPSADRY
ncbi:hypothetical protein L1887_54122 [Cichorium endivia]|nr:hypothetical protein L1887_54122 [Cichorium endivia]